MALTQQEFPILETGDLTIGDTATPNTAYTMPTVQGKKN